MKIYINNIDYEIEIVRKKVKRIYLKVTRNNQIIIVCSKKISEDEISNFINSHTGWLSKQLKKERKNVLINEIYLFGKKYHIYEDLSMKEDYIITDDKIIYCNFNKFYKDQLLVIRNQFYIELKKFKLDFIPRLDFRKMKSRWGSCKILKHEILLNKGLIYLPMSLISYVICHELSHFLVPNHSKTFYYTLALYYNDYKKANILLKEYSSLLY